MFKIQLVSTIYLASVEPQDVSPSMEVEHNTRSKRVKNVSLCQRRVFKGNANHLQHIWGCISFVKLLGCFEEVPKPHEICRRYNSNVMEFSSKNGSS